jgi:hypothetical protein
MSPPFQGQDAEYMPRRRSRIAVPAHGSSVIALGLAEVEHNAGNNRMRAL